MFFASLHSSKRKFAPAQYVNRERFLSPYLHSLFVICSSARATRTFFSSSFLYLPVRLAPSFLRLFFICLCGSHRHLFVFCSSFVRLLFVFCLSACAARTVFCLSFVYLPARLGPSFVCLFFIIRSSLFHFCVATFPLFEGARERFSSSFVYLSVWLTPSFIWLLFV